MFRFLCVLFYVVGGIKFQVRGYSMENCAGANQDAFSKIVRLMDENGVDQDLPITRSGEEYYKDGKPYCLEYWRNGQTPSPYTQ